MSDQKRRDQIVADLVRWYVGPDGDPLSVNEIGQWRDILNEAAARLAELEKLAEAACEYMHECRDRTPDHTERRRLREALFVEAERHEQ